MRFVAILFLAPFALACSGSPADIGDAGNDAKGFTCNGSPCQGYCIHPNDAQCPTCTPLADGGACPPNATVQEGCPTGPAMPPGQYCVVVPPPAQPYCSDVIVSTCLGPGVDPGPESTDVYCVGSACAL